MSSEKQDFKLAGWEVPLVTVLIGGGIWTQYGSAIQIWFFNNLGRLALGGSAFLALVGYFIYLRWLKKNKEEFGRLRRLSNVRPPNRPMDHYYRRPDDRNLQ